MSIAIGYLGYLVVLCLLVLLFAGIAWRNKGEYDRAIADYNEAIRLDPECVEAYDNMAWVLATCVDAEYRNEAKAVELATDSEQFSYQRSLNLYHAGKPYTNK